VDYNKRASKLIYERIPHRPPFLWVDEIIQLGSRLIEAKKHIPSDLDIFKGHYPGYPILPGVLLCEAVFQAGAVLLSEIINKSAKTDDMSISNKVPVLTRILNAKFKRQVKPGDIVHLQVKLKETLGSAWFLDGKAYVNGELAVKVDFSCALVAPLQQ